MRGGSVGRLGEDGPVVTVGQGTRNTDSWDDTVDETGVEKVP